MKKLALVLALSVACISLKMHSGGTLPTGCQDCVNNAASSISTNLDSCASNCQTAAQNNLDNSSDNYGTCLGNCVTQALGINAQNAKCSSEQYSDCQNLVGCSYCTSDIQGLLEDTNINGCSAECASLYAEGSKFYQSQLLACNAACTAIAKQATMANAQQICTDLGYTDCTSSATSLAKADKQHHQIR